jgi:hypothetical protein
MKNQSFSHSLGKSPFQREPFRTSVIFGGLDMTDAQRRVAIKALIKNHTAANTTSKAVARATLISEGIYTKKGTLRVEFGGQPKKSKSAA